MRLPIIPAAMMRNGGTAVRDYSAQIYRAGPAQVTVSRVRNANPPIRVYRNGGSTPPHWVGPAQQVPPTVTATGTPISSVPPDGTLLKGSGPGIFVMMNGQRCLIPDWNTFLAMGYQSGGWQILPDATLYAIPQGPTLPAIAAAAPSSAAQVAASAPAQSAVIAATSSPSWLTDPAQALITGFPNWGLLAVIGGGMFLFMGGKRR
jgi:hypothetical protein